MLFTLTGIHIWICQAEITWSLRLHRWCQEKDPFRGPWKWPSTGVSRNIQLSLWWNIQEDWRLPKIYFTCWVKSLTTYVGATSWFLCKKSHSIFIRDYRSQNAFIIWCLHCLNLILNLAPGLQHQTCHKKLWYVSYLISVVSWRCQSLPFHVFSWNDSVPGQNQRLTAVGQIPNITFFFFCMTLICSIKCFDLTTIISKSIDNHWKSSDKKTHSAFFLRYIPCYPSSLADDWCACMFAELSSCVRERAKTLKVGTVWGWKHGYKVEFSWDD